MVLTYKKRFNKKYGFKPDEPHSIKEISDITGYKLSGLKTIFQKGKGAYKSNPQSVRPHIKSPEQWGYSRIYASVSPGSKAHKIDKTHLKK
tara:strand:- start:21 stop:293 length:273 start_codon:yes stop_codon:yes gene_type:complete